MFTGDNDVNRADWTLLQNGAVNLFWKTQIFEEARKSLLDLNYNVQDLFCQSGWTSVREQFSTILRWKEQFGYFPWTGNFDAFNDGLRELPFSAAGRFAIALHAYHVLVAEDRAASHALLDLLEYNARNHLLWGNTLIVLVQTDDNQYECSSLGGRSANWNSREWMNSNRGL